MNIYLIHNNVISYHRIGKYISVVIPAYNKAERIQPTIEAIDYYLKERFTDYEIIVIDDGSLDNTSFDVE